MENLIEGVKKHVGSPSMNSFWKHLKGLGIDSSRQGLIDYARPDCRAIRIDVLRGFMKTGISWEQIGKLLDKDIAILRRK